MNPKKDNGVIGIIIPSSWDPDGNVTGVSLQTPTETEYLIDSGKKGADVKALMHAEVRIFGKIRERIDGKKVIIVRAFEPLRR